MPICVRLFGSIRPVMFSQPTKALSLIADIRPNRNDPRQPGRETGRKNRYPGVSGQHGPDRSYNPGFVFVVFGYVRGLASKMFHGIFQAVVAIVTDYGPDRSYNPGNRNGSRRLCILQLLRLFGSIRPVMFSQPTKALSLIADIPSGKTVSSK